MTRVVTLLIVLVFATATAAQLATNNGSGANLRALDKLTGQVSDLQVAQNQSQAVGRITIEVHECRYPKGNAAGEAYASLTIREVNVEAPIFEGWMIASAPALNPMDHQRYDVWVLRCTTS